MIPIDLKGKVALVTGVGDNVGFAWHIAKTLQAAGATLFFAVHPRLVGIVESIMERDTDAESRILPYGQGTMKIEKYFLVMLALTPWTMSTKKPRMTNAMQSMAIFLSKA